ncbi:MAG: DNA gyrase/topoisomerase IV subunit A [Acidobacteriota bacterium]
MSKNELEPGDERQEINKKSLSVDETFREYFLQYASYVITDRAIPDLADGLKPVQRRILFSLWENEDGRYNKVANLVGHCMKYHPHGDASIFSALVGLGQKGLLIDTQGNWGDPVTNDSPAAARYIEARLTKFAKEVLFAPHLTQFKMSYDGRNKEPLSLPVRFPLLLALGTEGIAVGLTTRILPHNFTELLEAQKAYLKGEPFQLYPDFPTGALIDVKDYRDGLPGSRIKVRATLEKDGKSIKIKEMPYGVSTETLIDSILAASEKGKIKVSNIQDNSAAEIEIIVTFQRGVDMTNAEQALYAFTDCEVSISSSSTVIEKEAPVTMGVSEILAASTERTLALLKEDLEYQLEKLEQKWHLRSLVQIFIENRIYLRIEKAETREKVYSEIKTGLDPFLEGLRRGVTEEDIEYLTEVKIRRISAWDAAQAREELLKIDEDIGKVQLFLNNITDYTIAYFDHLLEDYGAGIERKSKITSFNSIQAANVAERTSKLYVNRKGGFVGTDLKDAEEICYCSALDEVLTVTMDGGLIVSKVADRKYVGEDIVHAQLFPPEHRDAVFSMIYEDIKSGRVYLKKFQVGGYTRDKRYELGKTKEQTKILLFIPGSEDLFAHVKLRRKPRIKTDIYINFSDHLVKGRGAGGIILSRHKPSSARQISGTVFANRTNGDIQAEEEIDSDSRLPGF